MTTNGLLKKISLTTKCWLWKGTINKGGYGNYNTKSVHRLIYEKYKGPIPNGLFVLHTCDVRSYVRPDHLFLGTNQDNMDDMKIKGRSPNNLGEKNPFSKLTEKQVLEIKQKGHVPRKNLSLEYGVSEATIKSIRSGRNWSYIEDKQ